MPLYNIPKKTKGEFRQIYATSKKEKRKFRALLPELNRIAIDNCGGCVHGFMLGKSPVTNAKEHIGYQYTLSFDLKDFFDSVKPWMLKDYFQGDCQFLSEGIFVPDKIWEFFIDGRAYQGLPTSPQIANLAAVKMDERLMEVCAGVPIPFMRNPVRDEPNLSDSKIISEEIRYTRYADDLSFSFNSYAVYETFILEIPRIVSAFGFIINPAKTRLQSAKFGNRVITGVSVGATGISVPRRIKRRVKLAKYQKDEGTLKGLTEWAKLKLPHFPISHTLKVIDNVINYLKVKAIVDNKVPPVIDLSKVARRNGRGKRFVQTALVHLRKYYSVTPEIVTRVSKLTR